MEVDLSAGLRTPADVNDLAFQAEAALKQLPEGQTALVAADWRGCGMLTPDVAEQVVLTMGRNRRRVARRALLHDAQQPTCTLQLQRLVKEAGDEQRRAFTDVAALRAWLDQFLDDAERQRLHSFLNRRG